MRLFASYILTCIKDGKLTKIPLPFNRAFKVTGPEYEKPVFKKPEEMKVGESFQGLPIVKIKKPLFVEKFDFKKEKEIPLFCNLDDFVKEMVKLFPDDEWDLNSKEAKAIMDSYNVFLVRFLYMGLYVENIFYSSIYVPGKILKNEFEHLNQFEKPNLDYTVLEVEEK